MKMPLVACLLAAVAVTHVASQNDTTAEGDNVFLKVLGKSGKIMVGWQKDVPSDDRRVVIDFEALQELDGDKNAIKKPKHSFNSFATQDFTFTSIREGTIGTTKFKASFFTFTSKLKDLNSTVIVSVYIARENGSVTLGDETIPFKKDDVKMSIELNSWTWCTVATCQAEGNYVDLTLTVKSKGVPTKKVKDQSTGDADAYGLGFGTFLLSRKIQVDSSNTWQNMPTDYPQFQSRNGNQIFTFRFPKFTNSVLYDPTVSGDTAGGATGGCGRLAASALLLILATSAVKMLF